jgi:nucleoid DNA-binding protein
MRNWNRWLAGGVLCLAVGLTLGFVTEARSQRPAPTFTGPLDKEISTATKLEVDDVNKVLRQLGPVISAKLARGERIEIAGLGTFRVVRVGEHRDMIDGRPGVVAAYNYVEFLPVQEIVNAANAPGAVPSETVPAFQYNVLPNQIPSLRVPNVRAPSTRVP